MIEFLIWLPSVKRFATYFLSSKTSRRQAPALRNLLRKAATLKVELIRKGKYSWHGPVVTPCSTPFELPLMEEVVEQAAKFADTKEAETAPVEAGMDRPR